MANNIPLNILDEYAKCLTTKQANMLYESKLNKKYKKILNEGKEYQSLTNNNIMLDKQTLKEMCLTSGNIIDRYVNKLGLQYNVFNGGIHLYTPLIESYVALLTNLMNEGLTKEKLMSLVYTEKDKNIIKNLK